jgi:hypothetical protein
MKDSLKKRRPCGCLQGRWADRVDGGAVVARTVGIGIQSFEKLIRRCNIDHPSPPFWENLKYEYDGAVLFGGICGPGRNFVWRYKNCTASLTF